MMPVGISSNSSPRAPIGADDMPVLVPWNRIESFVGQLTHDVRNGLNALELQLTFLGEISTDPEAVDEVKRLRGTLQNVTRQLQTVKTITGAVVAHVLEYPAADFFEDLRERLERLHPEKSGQVSWNMDVDTNASLLIDPDLSINGLLELFANTFRFGGSSIRCTTVSDAASVTFVLQETPIAPPSISPERWGHEPLLTSQRGAYGLGLFRLRRILESQDGELRAAFSRTENLLITTVSLPRSPARTAG